MFQMVFKTLCLGLVLIAHIEGIVHKSTQQHVFVENVTPAFKTKGRWVVTFIDDFNYLKDHVQRIKSNFGEVIRLCSLVRASMSVSEYHQESYVSALDMLFWEAKDMRTDIISKADKLFSNLLDLNHHRSKRALLPLGNLFKFLIGVSSEEDVEKIKQQVNQLAISQENIVHSVKDSLTVINLTRSEIADNRNAINELIDTTRSMNIHVENVSSEILSILLPMHKFITAYMHLKSCISELEYLSGKITPPFRYN